MNLEDAPLSGVTLNTCLMICLTAWKREKATNGAMTTVKFALHEGLANVRERYIEVLKEQIEEEN